MLFICIALYTTFIVCFSFFLLFFPEHGSLLEFILRLVERSRFDVMYGAFAKINCPAALNGVENDSGRNGNRQNEAAHCAGAGVVERVPLA